MAWIEGFRMGSDTHYLKGSPAHRVFVHGFWIDRTPVTTRQFREFVKATGHVTVAEIVPDAKDYPGLFRTCSRPGCWCSICQKISRKVLKAWLAPLRAELLPPLPPGCAVSEARGHLDDHSAFAGSFVGRQDRNDRSITKGE
jgi:formylglycine-generating enzyme required for sulfatase activity